MRRHWIAPVAASVLAVAVGSAVIAAPPHQEGCVGNLLANPNFDGGSRKTENLGTSLSSAVSDGWFPWFVRGSENVNREPEFKVEQLAIGGDPYRVRSGGQSMKWFTTWATHDAGIYQQVAVPAGAALRFTIHGMVYSGEDDGWDGHHQTFLSDPARPGNYRIYAGIDPTGAVPSGMGAPPPPSVVWSPPSLTTDTWVPLTVDTVAGSNTVTVYAKGQPEWSVKHNDSFWEDACLVVTGSAVAAPVAAEEAADETEALSGDADEATEAADSSVGAAAETVATPTAGAGEAVVPMARTSTSVPLVQPVLGKHWAVAF